MRFLPWKKSRDLKHHCEMVEVPFFNVSQVKHFGFSFGNCFPFIFFHYILFYKYDTKSRQIEASQSQFVKVNWFELPERTLPSFFTLP